MPGKDEATLQARVVGASNGRTSEEDERVRLAEQERIAVDLGQSVIKRIFSVGLELQSCASLVDGPAAQRLEEAVDQLDQLIVAVRQVVFSLHSDGSPSPSGGGAWHHRDGHDDAEPGVVDVRERAQAVLSTAGASLDQVLASAAVDRDVDTDVVEGITNASRLVELAGRSLSPGPS